MDTEHFTISIKISVPKKFDGVGPWNREQSIDSFVSHWLEEGYFAHDHIVSLPCGIEYLGYTIQAD